MRKAKPSESVSTFRAYHARGVAITLCGLVAVGVYRYTYAVFPKPSSNNTTTGAASRRGCYRLSGRPGRLPRGHSAARVCGIIAVRNGFFLLADGTTG
jgi:hypothetical protein